MGEIRGGDCGCQHPWCTAAARRPSYDRSDHLANRQWREMAFDPGRTWRLAPCLSAVPPLGGQRGMGQDHGPSGGAEGTATGAGLRRRHHHARPSKGVRCAAWPSAVLSLRFIRNVADRVEALGRSRGGLGTKVVGVCDAAGRLVDFLLVPGQAHELAPSLTLLRRLPDAPSWVLADRACDASAFRSEMRAMGAIPVVPSRRGAKDPQPCPDYIYRHRNLIERVWSRLKERRAVATRYDKTATSYAACIAIAASLDWIKSLISKSRNANGPVPLRRLGRERAVPFRARRD